MDFQLYSLGAALVFHEIFFPESSTAMALILAMGTYGAGGNDSNLLIVFYVQI
ncbi:TPA: MHS family MFS transporter, partial [Escherichia coli]|nr:MHS family MFS transporter [Escherichia coli]